MDVLENKDLTFLETDNRDEWLELRKKSIGGSDAAVIAGLNSYKSPYALWVEKTGKGPLTESVTEAMRQGTDLEDYVAKRFEEKTGKSVKILPTTIKNSAYPFAHANVDRWILGENAGLECKTTNSLNLKRFENGSFPAVYYLQCLHYMAVTGAEKFYLAVLIFGKDFKVYTIERDEALIAQLMKAEENFWQYVENDIAPPVDGTTATDKALNEQFNDVTEETIDVSDLDDEIRSLLALKDKRKVLDKDIKRLEQCLKERLGENESGVSELYKVTWKSQTRNSFQAKMFQEDNPDLDLSNYYKTTSSRILRVKEIGD